jgi:hypothetical protein
VLDIRKALALGLLLTGLLVGTASAKGTPRASTGSPVRFNFEEGHFDSLAQARAMARRYQVLISFADLRLVPVMHRANPHLKVLMYQWADSAMTGDPTAGMACTTVPQALAHPSWLAHMSSGAPVVASGNYAAQLGDPGYQRACVGHMIALAKRGGFDGIFLDGVNYRFSYGMSHTALNPYGSDAAFQAAMYSFISYAGRTAHANGLELFANMAAADSAEWAKWNGPLDGAEEESWTDGSLGLAQQIPWWHEKLANAAWSEAHGKYILLHSYNMTEPANVYGLAAMLLIANGHASYSTWHQGQQQETWFPEYNTAKRLGRALGSYRILRNGLYVRRFAHGIVLVNPTGHTIRRFSLHRHYSGTHLRHVRTVALGPLSALILLRAR